MYRKTCFMLVCILVTMLPVGCAVEEVYDPMPNSVVTAWDYHMAQPTDGMGAEAILAGYAALPQPADKLIAAQIWALAVQQRNGYAQYSLLDGEAQQRQRISFEAAGWVGGLSSPWVESFEISEQKDGYHVRFQLKTSAGTYGHFSVLLGFGNEGSRISSITPTEGTAQPYVVAVD